jgi:hypothetical protein
VPAIPETGYERIAEQQLKGQCHKIFPKRFLRKFVCFRIFSTIYIFITDNEEVKEVKEGREGKEVKKVK